MTRHDTYIPITIFIFFLLLYLSTMPPTVYWQDAGIYLSGIKVEGNVYPPGYPLYMILGIIWTKIIPIGTFTIKVHALSAVLGAASASIAYIITNNLIQNNSTLFNKKSLSNREELDGKSTTSSPSNVVSLKIQNSVCKGMAIFSSLLIGLNFNTWAQAINAEVYSLHAFFFLSILLMIVKLGIIGRIEKLISSKQKKLIILIAITYGLSFGNHPMTVILIPVFVYLLISQKNILYHSKLLLVAITLFIISGLGTYSYLPLIANTRPSLNWGNPNTFERFIQHTTGKTYLTTEESFVINDPTRYQAALSEFVWEFGYIGLFIAVIGLLQIYRRDTKLPAIFLLIILFHIIFAVFYKQTTEYNSWLIPVHCTLAIIIAITLYNNFSGLQTLFTTRKNALGSPQPISAATYIYALGSLFVLGAFLFFLIPHWIKNSGELNRSNYYYAQDFGENILRQLDPNSIIIMTGDQESSTIMYLQSVLNFRTDVIAFKNIEAIELTYEEGRSQIKNRYPRLTLPPEKKAQADSEYYNDLIESNIGEHSVYMMSKNLFSLDTSKYTLQPAAAMYKIVPKSCLECLSEPDEKYWQFQYHDPLFYTKSERPLMSLKDSSQPGGINRVPFIQHMINFELQSWKNLGDAYYERGECKKAVNSYNKMTHLDKNIFSKVPQIQQNIQSCI